MKKILAVILTAVMILTFFGCADNKTKNYDADVIADTLNNQLQFGEALEKSTAEAAYSVYGIEESLCTKVAYYCGSGATADEIAVFNCIDESALNEVLTAAETRADYLREGYSSYGPEEVPKIDNAVVTAIDNTVILCICENSDAAFGIIDSASR